jgi:hypothetical protein
MLPKTQTGFKLKIVNNGIWKGLLKKIKFMMTIFKNIVINLHSVTEKDIKSIKETQSN